MNKKFYVSLASLLIVASAVISLNFMGNISSAATRYCDTNSIMKCGALTATELQQKYAANTPGDLGAIYDHYGISSAMIANAGSAKMGTVSKSGNVSVDGVVIATSALSVGRHTTSGSTAVTTGGTTVYQRPTQNVFIDESQTAFVFLDGQGQFLAAIITSCGNPVLATPIPKPVPPPVVPPVVPPTPVYSCTSLTATKIDRTSYRFAPKASAQNATITGYKIDFGDGSNETLTATQTTTTHTYANPGNYNSVLTAVFSVNSIEKTATAPACAVVIAVATPPCTVPGKEAYPVDSPLCKEDVPVTPVVAQPTLPSTGPGDLIGGGFALSSLTAAGYYWSASRRNLISKFLNR